MAPQTLGTHHFQVRKRIHQKHEPYPHPHPHKRLIDKIIYIAGVLGPVMTIPQAAKIWLEKSAAGVSALTWGALCIISLVWLVYGIAHKEKPIIITYSLWAVMNALIFAGALVYG